MSDEPEKKDDPAEELKQGLTHLWRAARSVGREVKKEVERTDIGKALDDAGREFVRAAANVADRITAEVTDLTRPHKPSGIPDDAPPKGEAHQSPPEEEDEFDGVKPKEKAEGSPGPTPQDPGFRIAVDDEKKKPE